MLGNDLRWHTKANVIGRELLESWFHASEAPSGARASTGQHGQRRR
jgi:hypothetical protein